jgi:arylsulfatase A-like enzyme
MVGVVVPPRGSTGSRRGRGRFARATSSLLLALTVLLVLTMAGSAQEQPAERPDIVVIYLDDVDPHDARLWDAERRTPTLSRLFARAGVQFSNAISETPLCSPGRASTLTGLHTANTGVAENVTKPFDPRVTLGTELQDAGYHTIFAGKYLNKLRDQVRQNKLKRYARGWDAFDIIYENNGKFFDYATWSPDKGIRRYGHKAADHSTLVAKRNLTGRLRAAPTDEPVFVFASLFDLHDPNLPARKYENAKRCRSIAGWAPPSYNEANKGKPRFIRKRQKLNRSAWPMQTYCEEMLGVEEATAALVREQRRRGRLDDTLFIFTADNGVAWGIHRLPQRKGVPYATPIPLVMSWPARWGEAPVTIDEVVSNIDLAPTICEIAGCEMGPFKGGPPTTDGLSLLPLLDGQTDHLDRTLVREERSGHYADAPAFRAIRTTSQHPLGRWHYIEWATGERELYDSVADPWELHNLVKDAEHRDIAAALSDDLRAEFSPAPDDGTGPHASASPDASAGAAEVAGAA